MVVLLASAFAGLSAWLGASFIANSVTRRWRSLDQAGGDLRKVHVNPTPRVGGLSVLAGVVAGAFVLALFGGDARLIALLLICAAPAFAWGLIEDLSKRGAVLVRLALTGTSAALAFVLLDARLTGVDVPGLDTLLAVHGFSFLFTVFAVTGVANAMNIIDGLNGLSGITALCAAIGLALVSWIVGDQTVFAATCLLAAGILGFLVVNFPKGRIFLGDGGAYLVGLLLAELSVMLVNHNSEVSPWCPLVLLAYPIWETLFSMYRRRIRGRSPGAADALHLHSLVYRRIVRWCGYEAAARECTLRNSVASMCLWFIPGLCCIFAVTFWNKTGTLQVIACLFIAFYLAAYWKIVRFGVPRWLVVRAKHAEQRLPGRSSSVPLPR
jgi:UDP-GlcNAc:undecaprenyl-phosphate/decaprenyl-phosphate GlcNAc-1-phosphate transferase